MNKPTLHLLLILMVALVFGACQPVVADEGRPVIPPIEDRVTWVIDRIPANLSVVYPGELEVAYPVLSSTPIRLDDVFVDSVGIWKFTGGCTQYTYNVRQTPIAWRVGLNSEWQTWTLKTYQVGR